MRRAAVVAAALAAAALAACGSDDGSGTSAPVAWESEPGVYVPENLPGDRILSGRLRNEGDETVELDSVDVRLLDADGNPVEADARFVSGFVHGNIPLDIQPGPEQPEPSQLRLGYRAKIKPGESVPLTVSWRQRGAPRPLAVVLGDGTRLELPQRRPKKV